MDSTESNLDVSQLAAQVSDIQIAPAQLTIENLDLQLNKLGVSLLFVYFIA